MIQQLPLKIYTYLYLIMLRTADISNPLRENVTITLTVKGCDSHCALAVTDPQEGAFP